MSESLPQTDTDTRNTPLVGITLSPSRPAVAAAGAVASME